MQADLFRTQSLRDERILRILSKAIAAVNPAALVSSALRGLSLRPYRRLFLLGLGKAAEKMAEAAAHILPDLDAALVITKHRTLSAQTGFAVLEGGHPVPDARSLTAGSTAAEFVRGVGEDDLLLCLISGGGSSLAMQPTNGVSLTDMRTLTSSLLASGASIEEVNILRRELDDTKGGGLSAMNRGRTLSLILSDVIGDRLEAIASGPTAPNPTGAADARDVLKRFGVQAPESIEHVLTVDAGARKAPDPGRIQNVIIGNVAIAWNAAIDQARTEGFSTLRLESTIQGEASAIGRGLGRRLSEACGEASRPFAMVAAGETTVTLNSGGRGGRNQEVALAAVDVLAGSEDCLFVSCATDGEDGPTDAAGAVVTGETRDRASALGMRTAEFLARHDSYPYFDALGDLLKPGQTGTNVNDLMLLFGL